MNRIDALDRIGHSTRTADSAASPRELDLAGLWQAFTVSRDEGLHNRLLLHYLHISKMIARHLHTRMPATVDLDDLSQAAALGLRSSIASYDPSRGIPFENYCGPRVRGAVLDHLRSLDWAPRMLRSRVQRVQEMVRQIEMQTGTVPSDEEVSSALSMPLDELRSLRGELAAPIRVRVTSTDDDQEHAVNLDALPDGGASDPFRELQRSDLREFLLKGLSPIERQVLILYYYENLSLREIGETIDLCESRVSQIHQGVIQRLRERMHRIGGSTVDE